MRAVSIIYFVEGATDPVDEFDAKCVRYIPVASGPEDCDTKVSCFHLAPGSQMAEECLRFLVCCVKCRGSIGTMLWSSGCGHEWADGRPTPSGDFAYARP
jgi:hypothetical protein